MTSSSPSSKIDDPPIPKTDEDDTGTASASQETDDDVDPDKEIKKVLNRLSELESINLRQDMDYFISRVEKDDYKSSKKHLKLFTSHSCADSFCLLYLSHLTNNRILGSHLITRFLALVDDKLDEKLLPYVAPSVVRFCKLLGRSRLIDDPVINHCIQRLRWIFVNAHYKELLWSRLRKLVRWDDIFFIGDCLDACSEGIVKFKCGVGFRLFVRFVVSGILESVCSEIPVPVEYCRASSSSYYEQLRSLHDLFDELVSKMDLCLAKGDQCLSVSEDWTCEFKDVKWDYLNMISSVCNISKIYQGAGKRVWKMFEKRKDTFKYLVRLYVSYRHINVDEEFNWIFDHKELLDFECRWRIARKVFPCFHKDNNVKNLQIKVDRFMLLDDSCDQINKADAKSLQVTEGFSVSFIDEEAFGEGVKREWFILVCKEIFNPQIALFISNENDRRRFHINPDIQVQDRHLEYFRFCGRVIGLALFEEVQVGVTFDNVLFKQLAGLDIQLEDIENTDTILYKSLKHLLYLDADYVDSDALGLTFSIEFVSRGVVELLPGGESIKVNSRNRKNILRNIYTIVLLPLRQIN